MSNIIALDIADHLGIAYLDNEDTIYTDVLHYPKLDTYLSGKYQLDYITQFPLDSKILIEDFNYYDSNRNRGKITFIKRMGFIEYTLRSLGYDVELLHINENRKKYCEGKPKQKRVTKINKKGEIKLNKAGKPQFNLSGIKPKDWIHTKICQYTQLSLTNDHTDAILLLMAYLNLEYDNLRDRVILL